MPIDIYMMKLSAPCRAVLMTARQINIDLNEKNVDLLQGEQLKPEYLKLNPNHVVPTIVDNGFILWESRVIMQYLCNKYAPDSPLYPKDPQKRAIVERLLYFDLSLSASQKGVANAKMMTGTDLAEDDEKIIAFKNNLKTLDQLLAKNKYLTGNQLTIADLSVLATTVMLDLVKYDVTDYPNYKRWKADLKSELPYYEEINHFEEGYLQEVMQKYKAMLIQKTQKQ